MSSDENIAPKAPPRAFTQGTGLVFQVVGGVLFLAMMSMCCISGLFSKDWAQREQLTQIGWGVTEQGAMYSVQRALTISLAAGVFFGLGLAGVGLGMQAEHRAAAPLAVVISGLATLFSAVHAVFAWNMGSIFFSALAALLTIVFALLFMLAVSATIEMKRHPPPSGHEVLPKDYKVPYSHLHEDPPEVRLDRELQQRRQRLEAERKQIEALEERLRKKSEQ